MNTNLNNIPLEIYVDYCNEQTNLEWSLEIFLTTIVYDTKQLENFGVGNHYYSYFENETETEDEDYLYNVITATGNGDNDICTYGYRNAQGHGYRISNNINVYGYAFWYTCNAKGDGKNYY